MNQDSAERALHCPNCGTEVFGDYCHKCGQSQKDYHISLSQFFREFLDEYLSVDSKLIRSLAPLIIKPGYLVNEYLSGKRVSYIKPLRLYLFISLVFFLVIALGSSDPVVIQNSGTEPGAVTADSMVVQSTMQMLEDSLGVTLDSTESEKLQALIARAVSNSTQTEENADSSEFLQVTPNASDPTGNTWDVNLHIFGIQREYTLTRENFQRSFMSNLPKMMFLLLPVFALLLKLLYIRRKRLYIEHLVFAFYTHSFVFLLGSIMILNPVGIIDFLLFLGMVVYMYLAMNQVYHQSHIKTVLKFTGLFFLYIFTLAFALVGNVFAIFLLG